MPLDVHGLYGRSEILAALGVASLTGGQKPGTFAQGVLWVEKYRTDVLLNTLDKEEKQFSESTRYQDYAQSLTEFHWESQNSTAPEHETGQRYIEHAERDPASGVLLFTRHRKTTATGKPQPWMCLGPATYKSHSGRKPMSIAWELQHPMPDEVWEYAKRAA